MIRIEENARLNSGLVHGKLIVTDESRPWSFALIEQRLCGPGLGLPAIALALICGGCTIAVVRRLGRGGLVLLARTP